MQRHRLKTASIIMGITANLSRQRAMILWRILLEQVTMELHMVILYVKYVVSILF